MRDFKSWPVWIWFLLFAVTHGILAYTSFSYTLKGWMFLAVFIFAYSWMCGATRPKSSGVKPVVFQETLPSIFFSTWLIIVLLLLAVFFRLYRLTSLYVWPTGDEGLNGFFAIDLAQEWKWDFFYTCGQLPPLLTWILALLFKSHSSFFSLWVVPGTLSILTLTAGYLAARHYFSRSFALLSGILLGFSFWPLYSGRFCHQGVLVPLWECIVFFILVFFLKTRGDSSKRNLAFILGLFTGLGSFTFTSWPVVVPGVILGVLYHLECFKPRFNSWRTLISFFAGLVLALVPFSVSALIQGYGDHVFGSSALTGWYTGGHQFLTSLSYLTVLFWGPLQSGTSYGPSWGGMLNPLLSACFWLGAAELFYFRSNAFARWVVVVLFFALLPGLLSADYVEMFRISQAMPLILLVAAMGLQKLLSETRVAWRPVALVVIVFFSFGLDLYHFLKPVLASSFPVSLKRDIPDENFRAYQKIVDSSSKMGPGLIFTEFLTLDHGHTLYVTSYGLNAASNPGLGVETAKWAGILTNVYYQPFLAERFPEARWNWCGMGSASAKGGLVLGIVPVVEKNKELFRRWLHAHAYFHELNLDAERSSTGKAQFQKAVQRLREGRPLVAGDRFLESCYWEWAAQYFYDPSYEGNASAIREALQRGYPAAHLYEKLGDFLTTGRRAQEAAKAYQAAAKLRNDFPWDWTKKGE